MLFYVLTVFSLVKKETRLFSLFLFRFCFLIYLFLVRKETRLFSCALSSLRTRAGLEDEAERAKSTCDLESVKRSTNDFASASSTLPPFLSNVSRDVSRDASSTHPPLLPSSLPLFPPSLRKKTRFFSCVLSSVRCSGGGGGGGGGRPRRRAARSRSLRPW